MGNLCQDLRYGVQALLRKPDVTAMAVLTIAPGIGTNTVIFSLVNAILLTPLPFQAPACWTPARRATKTDAMIALRHE